ncbi:D-alanine--D-alanine ligase [bacterium BMS3Abin03]|nr:D-alanine--D-alanine ligase [bacterium BMS3Abin03]
MADTKIKIALFVGGTSPEREVSKASGKAIYEAIKSLGYSCILIDPAYGENQPDTGEKFFSNRDHTRINNENIIKTINSGLLDDVDLVFLALHGKYGEDGTIQSILELRKIKYTGSGIFSSMVSMDKAFSKTLFHANNVNTPDWFTIENNLNVEELNQEIKETVGFPCVIKPNDQGSTVGLTITRKDSEISDALKLAFQYSDLALIEKYIPGREMTVAILDDKPLPVLEIIPKSGFYDYKSKYTNGMSEYIVPAKIPEDVFSKIQQQALAAFKALRCKVYARVDFRLDEKNVPYCLEVNTLPGMTSTSLVPKMANVIGISFEELIDKIIRKSLNGS